MSDEALPRRVGPYRLQRLLGRGGMGAVYLAWDERLERWVAVKRVLAGEGSSGRRERLRREARAAAGIAHPAVVQIFDLVEEEDGDWIVMERVEGGLLSELLAEGPLGPDRVLDIGRQIAEGLTAAHARGIVHRDLKAENVAVLPDGRVKILDFGLAKKVGWADTEEGKGGSSGEALALSAGLTSSGQVLGTCRAMSPEQARGLAVGPASDLFSLGVLLYEAAAGVSPFQADTAYDTLHRVITQPPPPLEEAETDGAGDTPRELAALIERLLAKAPELRPAGAREVAEALGRIAEQRRSGRSGAPPVASSPAWDTATAVDLPPPPPAGAEADPSSLPGPSPATEEPEGSHGYVPPRRRLFVLLAALLAAAALGAGWLSSQRWKAAPEDGREATEESFEPSEESRAEPVPASRAAGEEIPPEIAADADALVAEGFRAVLRVDRPESVERAAALFQRALELAPDSARAHAGLARAYLEKARNASGGGDPVFLEQADAVAREAVRLDPADTEARVSLGLVELLRGNREAARRELEEARRLDAEHPAAHYGLAKVAEAEGRSDEAEGLLRRAVESAPTSQYFDALGALQAAGGDYAAAEASFQASLKIAPDNAYALRNLGGLAYLQGRPEEAAELFRSALAIRPDASLHSNLGTLFFSRGLYHRAAESFEAALRMDGASNKPIYWMNLADAYRQLPGRNEEAALHYRRAAQLLGEELASRPDDPRRLSRRALALARLGDISGARDSLGRLRKTGVETDAYSLFRASVASELVGDREAALDLLRTSLDGGVALSEIRREPDLLDLRADPRFHRLLMEREAEGSGGT